MALGNRLVVLFSAAMLMLAFVTASFAAAPQSAFRSASLCTVAKGVAVSLEKPPTTGSLTSSQAQAQFKHNLGAILAAKGALVAAAPGSLKPDMRRALGVFALFKTDLGKVNYNFAALATKPAIVRGLETAITKSKPAFRQLRAYFRNTCHY